MSNVQYKPIEDDETPQQREDREEHNRRVDSYIEESKDYPGLHWTKWLVGWEPY